MEGAGAERGQVQRGRAKRAKGRDGMGWNWGGGGASASTAIDPFLAIPAIVTPPASEVTRGETPDPILARGHADIR